MGKVREETRHDSSGVVIQVVEKTQGEIVEPWHFITLEADWLSTMTPPQLRELGRWLIREGKRIGQTYKSTGALRNG